MNSRSILAIGVVLLAFVSAASADEIFYSCSGSYKSDQDANLLDPSTISVSATLAARMLGDENVRGEYSMEDVDLDMVSTNVDMIKTQLPGLDAGSFHIHKPILGKVHKARNKKYKGYIRFDLGSNGGDVYANLANVPETYLLIPTEDSKPVYIQRSRSGHDVYPTVTLKCSP